MTLERSPHVLPSAAEMRAYDSATIDHGTSSRALMERAGRGVFEIIKSRCAPLLTDARPTLILCGPGNNGGDGLVLARVLAEHAHAVTVILVAAQRYTSDLLQQIEQLSASPAAHRIMLFLFGSEDNASEGALNKKASLVDANFLRKSIAESALIVDALLGTGATPPPRGTIDKIIEVCDEELSALIPDRRPTVIAIDIPSGIDPDSGAVPGRAVCADFTCAIEWVKRGMLQYPARKFCGELLPFSIGIEMTTPSRYQILNQDSLPHMREREPDAHKGNFGRVLVIGGCRDMPGAPLLSARAALRSGAGLVHIAQLSSFAYEPTTPELMRKVLPDSQGYFDLSHLSQLEKLINEADVLVLGPGLGMREETYSLVVQLLHEVSRSDKRLVLDADGLNYLARARVAGEQFAFEHGVLTPHPGEMGRLLGITTDEVQRDRYRAVATLHEATGAVVVLKGPGSIVYGGRGFVNTSGNAALATAGSGDVLSGMIAGFIAQGYALVDAAALGVYLHGACADQIMLRRHAPLIASDLIEEIPNAIDICQREQSRNTES